MEIKSDQLWDQGVGHHQDWHINRKPILGLIQIILIHQNRFHLQSACQESLDQRFAFSDEPTAEAGQIRRAEVPIGI
jgi:hypothetical protein